MKVYSENFAVEATEMKIHKIFFNEEPIEWEAVNVMGLIPSKHSLITQVVEADKKINTRSKYFIILAK